MGKTRTSSRQAIGSSADHTQQSVEEFTMGSDRDV